MKKKPTTPRLISTRGTNLAIQKQLAEKIIQESPEKPEYRLYLERYVLERAVEI